MTEVDFIYDLIVQQELEMLSPKLEQLKEDKFSINITQGGRGAGAKSHCIASLILQKCNKEKHRVVCLREVFGSLEESVYTLLCDKIKQLRQNHWVTTKSALVNKKTGSKIIFRGLVDLRAGQNIKGLEKYDIWWLEEAQMISEESLKLLIPTMVRNENYRLYITYNPETEYDPVTIRYWNSNRSDVLKIRCESGIEDNPWWNDKMTEEMEADFKRDPEYAEHAWNGHPRSQGQCAIMSAIRIREAMIRVLTDDDKGLIEIGIDVARFGDDSTVFYKRKGFKVIERMEFRGLNTQEVAKEAWHFANMDPSIDIKVDDTGVGGGVTDRLVEFGASVIPINFASNAEDEDRYTSVIDEMWFEFPLDDVDMPDDPELMKQLSGRQYGYDKRGRRKVESKKEYKKRLGYSPDDADALLLCFYESQYTLSPEIANALRINRGM